MIQLVKLSFVLLTMLLIHLGAQAQLPYLAEQSFPKDSLIKDLRLVEKSLIEGHAGLHNYSSHEQIKRAFEVAYNGIKGSITEREFTLVLARLIAEIQCGHTFVRLSLQSLEKRKENVGVFPLKLMLIDGKAYVLHNYTSDSTIVKGLEVTEVNEKKMSGVINDIFPLIPADGGNQGWKAYQLGKNFDYYYRLKYGNVTNYTFRFSDGQANWLKSINPMDRDTLKKIRNNRYATELNIPPLYYSQLYNDKVGYLRVNSFSDVTCNRYNQTFKKYIKKSFKTLRKTEINHLILDLRGNVGGNTNNVIDLARYLKTNEFKPYESIKLNKSTPLSYVNYSKKLAKFTYENTTTKDGVVYWDNKKNTQTYKTRKKRYQGFLVVLIDGSVFSGGSHLSSLLDGRDQTLFVGEKTGGGAKFSNAGVMTTIVLPISKVRLSIPMFKGVYDTDSPNSIAVFPDKKLAPTQNGLLSDRDEVMELVFHIVKKMIAK